MAPLLERERELSTLRTLTEHAAAGGSGLLVIEGPAGIGKTRLVTETRRQAAQSGVSVLTARGGELEQELAFGIVRQLFEDAASGGEPVPDGAREVFERPATGVAGEDASFAILHGLYWLTMNLAETAPVLLAVDDLQWADEPSLRYLAYLVRRLDGLPVTVLCGVRPIERHSRAHLLAEIIGDPLAVSVHPLPLSERAAAELLGADEAFAHAGHEATGGNPLLLAELLKTLRTEGVTPDVTNLAQIEELAPRAASRAVLVRLARQRREAIAMARATAVLGDEAKLPLAAALAGLPDQLAVVAAGQLVAAEIFADQATLAFVHPVIRAAVYEDIGVHDRALAHERAARLLGDRSADPGAIAAQLAHAPVRGEEWVVEALERAAHAAMRAGAPGSAVTHLTRALAEPPPAASRVRTLVALAEAEKLVDMPSAVAHATEALELIDDPLARGAASLSLARSLLITGRSGAGIALARRAAADLPPEAGTLRAALEAVELTAASFGTGPPVAAERYLPHRRLPLAAGMGPKLLAAVAAHHWSTHGGSAAECSALALAALEGGEMIGSRVVLLPVAATQVLTIADRDEAIAMLDDLLGHAHSRGSMSARSATSIFRGYALYRRGELADAEASLRVGLEALVLFNRGFEGRVHLAAWLAAVLRERGDLAGARRELEAVADPGDASEAARYWLDSLAAQLIAEEAFEDALAVAEDSGRRFASLQPVDTPIAAHQAIALHHLGRRDEAIAFATQGLEAARRWGAPGTVARALRILGTVEQRLEHLREAAALAARSPARLELAYALAAVGAGLRSARRPADAREPLREALALTEALGAGALAERVRHELYAAGGRPRTTALQGPESLTPSERRVTERAAAGQTNRAIAEALFVTPKTVELHLRNAYRKLGARGRQDLAALLVEASS